MSISRKYLALAFGLIAVQALVLYIFGQPPICTCGYVKFWEGVVLSSGNSQHLTDWYTFSHVIHGLLFYFGLWYFFPRTSVWMRLFFAVGIEAAWEIVENTPMVINHYREQALAQGYTGDSIINSVSDTVAMVFGRLMSSTSSISFPLFQLGRLRSRVCLCARRQGGGALLFDCIREVLE